jgi:hypothetical protein
LQDAVNDILDMAGSYSSGDDDTTIVTDICNSISTGKQGGDSVATGMVLIVFAQILSIGYWMKYTTLGALQSVKEAEDDAAKNNSEL